MPSFAALKPVPTIFRGSLLLALLGRPATIPAGTILSVTIAGGDLSLIVGDSLTLSALAATDGPVDVSVTWKSEPPTVVKINQTGLLTALAEGTTVITSTSTADTSKNESITVTIALPGSIHWTRQFGTSRADIGNGVATDRSGSIIVTGNTTGGLADSNVGQSDVFVRKYGR